MREKLARTGVLVGVAGRKAPDLARRLVFVLP